MHWAGERYVQECERVQEGLSCVETLERLNPNFVAVTNMYQE